MSGLLERLGASVGDILVKEKLLTWEQMEVVQQAGHALKGSFGESLLQLGLVEEAALYGAIARHLGVPHFDRDKTPMDPGAAASVPADLQQRMQAVPVRREKDRLYVAIADPNELRALDALRDHTGLRVVPLLATPAEIQRLLKAAQNVLPPTEETIASVSVSDQSDLQDLVAQSPTVRLFQTLLVNAVQSRASDIHIEPTASDFHVRFRIDGILHDQMKLDKKLMYDPLVSRVKVVANLDLAERRLPQDGRFPLAMKGKRIDVRVSTMPTMHGEKVVLRLLDKSTQLIGLPKVGMAPEHQKQLRWLVSRPHGMVLVTGPTGSGKTTTQYSLLHEIFTLDKNFVTIEDPVELTLSRVNQIQVQPKIGLTFATALRNILRQDPDVILVGEIRDPETAKLAVEASLTGHLVMATLHTNDCPSSPTRLVEMGVQPFLISASLLGVVSQRLARRICPECVEEYLPSQASLELVGFPADRDVRFLKGVGCNHCRQTGYYGRVGLFEVMRLTADLRAEIAKGSPVAAIRDAARVDGFKSLLYDGFEKVVQGLTTLEEVVRVVETLEG